MLTIEIHLPSSIPSVAVAAALETMVVRIGAWGATGEACAIRPHPFYRFITFPFDERRQIVWKLWDNTREYANIFTYERIESAAAAVATIHSCTYSMRAYIFNVATLFLCYTGNKQTK